MENIKLVALDMDGTLLDSNKNKPKDFISWVKSHKDIKVIIASGRQYQTLENDFKEIKDDLLFICENGSLVFEHAVAIEKNVIDKSVLLSCIDALEKVEYAHPILCGVNCAYLLENQGKDVLDSAKLYFANLEEVSDLRDTIKEKELVKIAVYFSNHDAQGSYKSLSDIPSDLRAVLSGDMWVDIFPPSVNKGLALKKIQKRFNIDKSQCMAFGDYINDIEMLECVEESYCMENGLDEVKAISKYIAASNDNDGVMNVLRKL